MLDCVCLCRRTVWWWWWDTGRDTDARAAWLLLSTTTPTTPHSSSPHPLLPLILLKHTIPMVSTTRYKLYKLVCEVGLMPLPNVVLTCSPTPHLFDVTRAGFENLLGPTNCRHKTHYILLQMFILYHQINQIRPSRIYAYKVSDVLNLYYHPEQKGKFRQTQKKQQGSSVKLYLSAFNREPEFTKSFKKFFQCREKLV